MSEGDLKASFSKATTPRCKGGHYSIPWIALLYPWSVPYNSKCSTRLHQLPFFEALVWLNLVLNPCNLDNWQTHYSLGPMAWFIYIYKWAFVIAHFFKSCRSSHFNVLSWVYFNISLSDECETMKLRVIGE